MCCRSVSRGMAFTAIGLVSVMVTPAFGQSRVSRSIEGPVTADKVERALVVIPGVGDPGGPTEVGLSLRVQFQLDSAALTPTARQDLDQVAVAFNGPQLAASSLILEGHTDATGDAGYNLRLSRRRAEAVVAYLVSRGVAWQRLSAVGYGESRPLPVYGPMDPRQRRVEIVRQF